MSHSDFHFSRGDIAVLAQKLDSVNPPLSDRERSLLLAVFTAAREHVVRIPLKGPDVPDPAGAGLQEQILNAFIPDEDNEDANLLIQSPASQIRISPVPVKPPPHHGKP